MCEICDRGRRERRDDEHFEVSALGFFDAEPDLRTIVGWTSDPAGGSLVKMIHKHPVWHSPEVRDTRQSEGKQ